MSPCIHSDPLIVFEFSTSPNSRRNTLINDVLALETILHEELRETDAATCHV